MKNNIRIFYRGDTLNESANARREAAKAAAIQAAVDYAGFDMDAVIVARVELTGSLCRVDFRYIRYEAASYRRCGMGWCSYVDVDTGEVLGFAGSTERASVDMEEPA